VSFLIDLVARLQFVTQYDQEYDHEGNYYTFADPCVTPQLGVKVGMSFDFPH
jgi:hypothetical protein